MTQRFLLAGAVGVLLGASLAADDVLYIERGSDWRYFRGLEEASSPDTAAWRQPGFGDSGWEVGPAPFGYRDGPFGTDLAALDPPMQRNYTSLYLRRRFQVTDPTKVVELHARVDYDDGFLIWINGRELVRENIDGNAGDPVPHDSRAASNRESGEYVDILLPDHDTFLVAGDNVVAVQALNYSITNSDFKIDIEIIDPFGPDLNPPAISAVNPARGRTVLSLAQVEITFTEPVAGVDAADLLVNGDPATAVTGDGPGPWIFTFPPAPPGATQVAFRADHGITDVAEARNPFGGGEWDYTVDPDAPIGDLVITELAAANRDGLRDEDGDFEDWIEIWNRSPIDVDLNGWGVTDDPDEPGKWTFPSLVLPGDGYLVVFASGKDRRDPAGELHTNFKLNASGEYLAIANAESPRAVVMEYSPGFPDQRPALSWGLDAEGLRVYFDTPSPGDPNGRGLTFAGVVAQPVFDPPHGFYDEPVSVRITTLTEGAATYYTLDGSEPSPQNGLPYEGPIEAAGDPRRAAVTIRAASYRDGLLPSDISTSTYVFLEHVPAQPNDPDDFPIRWGSHPRVDYEMDPEVVDDPAYRDRLMEGLLAIPSISIVMDVEDMFGARGIYSNPSGEGLAWEKPCSAELLFPDGRSGFQVNCGIRIQGGASRDVQKQAKHSFRLVFRGAYGPTKLRYPFFSDSHVESFDTITLRGGFNNSWMHWNGGQRGRAQFIRDQFARDTQLDMGQVSSHGTFVHLYVNGLYWGLYNPVERPSAPFGASYFGGEKEDYDAYNSAAAIDGGPTTWSTLMSLANRNFADPAAYDALAAFLDLPAFADYMLINFYGDNADWPHHNWYGFRKLEDGAKFRFICWDSERILEGVTSFGELGASDGNSPGIVHANLIRGPEYRVLFADRVHRHLFNGGALTPEAAAERWERRARGLETAMVGESARWGDYRRDVHRWQDPPFEFYRVDSHWTPERRRLLTTYFPRRAAALLNALRVRGLYPRIDAPVFSQHGGEITPPFGLEMSLPDGTAGEIWYTVDGDDPRVPWTDEVSPSARLYDGTVVLDDRAHVRARTLGGTTWSALNEATFTLSGQIENLYITEIMYNPPGGGAYEFIELHNSGEKTIELGGLRFTNGIDFGFEPNTPLRPGAYLVLVSDPTAFAERYPDIAVGGRFFGGLDNGGEKLTLRDAGGVTVLSVDYNDGGFWPIGPDGFGWSLVLDDLAGDLDDPGSWRESVAAGGSPGKPDPRPLHGAVAINEVLVRASSPFEAAIELVSLAGAPVDVGGWFLGDGRGDEAALKRFRIPAGTIVPADGFAVLYADVFGAVPDVRDGLALDAADGQVYIAAADGGGNLTGFVRGHAVGGSPDGVPFGRHETSVGLDFTALAAPTFGVDAPASVEEFRSGDGAPNAPPLIGAVVINEIHYHPAGGDVEFIELHNRTASAIALHDGVIGRGWRIGGISNRDGSGDFEFAPGARIAPNGFAIVVGIDPAEFRVLADVRPGIPIFGPWGGALDNAGERIELFRPEGIADDRVGDVLVDQVRFNDRDPWPLEADGGGPTLERVRAGEYANDPVNWLASKEPGGTPGAANSVSPPVDPGEGGLQRPGDCNQDGLLAISDAICMLNQLFLDPRPLPCAGEIGEAGNLVLLDLNADVRVNLTDPIYLLDYLFRGGPAPKQGLECLRIPGCPEVCASR